MLDLQPDSEKKHDDARIPSQLDDEAEQNEKRHADGECVFHAVILNPSRREGSGPSLETGSPAALVARVEELERRKASIADELAALRPLPRLPTPVIENRLAEWRRLLRQSTTQGRAVLQRVVKGRITFTPQGEGYEFEAPTRFDKLFTGIVVPVPSFINPTDRTGKEHIGPEDTWDADYGALLFKGVTSPTGTATFPVVRYRCGLSLAR